MWATLEKKKEGMEGKDRKKREEWIIANTCTLHLCSVLGTVLSSLHILIHFIIPHMGRYYCLHFIKKETEAQMGSFICQSQVRREQSQDLDQAV